MGLFSRKKEPEDLTKYGALKLTVLEIEGKSPKRITVSCKVESGRVGLGETLIYRPKFGETLIVKAEYLQAMMMDMKVAMEGTVVSISLSGDFDMMDPTEGDIIER